MPSLAAKSRLDGGWRFHEYPIDLPAMPPAAVGWRSRSFPKMPSTLMARRPRVEQTSFVVRGVSLRELLARDARGVRPPDIRATSCTSDWQQVRPGDVYVA